MSPPAVGINYNVNQVQATHPEYPKQKKYELPMKSFIKVTRCGIYEINGTYKKSNNRNGYASYISRGRIFLDRKPGRFILLRDAIYWYIGFQWAENEGTSKLDKTYYRADCVSKSEVDPPPCGGWIAIGSGVDPAPIILG